MSEVEQTQAPEQVPDTRPIWASYSSIQLHRTCPQKWFYQRVQDLQPIKDDVIPNRDYGSWWHALMAADALERGRRYGSLCFVPEWIEASEDYRWSGESVTPADVLAGAERYTAALSESDKVRWKEFLREDLPLRLERAYASWLSRWEAERGHERPLAVEFGWGRNLPGDSEVRLVGYVDEVYLDTQRNLVVVRDHKTAKSLESATAEDDLMDSQLHLYAWGANSEIETWGYGPVRATAHDRVKSIAPTVPRLNNSGTLSKSVTEFDIDTYLRFCESKPEYPGTKKDGSGAGVYEAEKAVVENLLTPSWRSKFHQRSTVPVNVNVIRSHLIAAVDGGEDMGTTRARGLRRGEATRSPGFHCRWCDYADLCRAQLIGGPDGEYDLAAMGLVREGYEARSDTLTLLDPTQKEIA